jgi:cytochrome c-type biogenesis protein
MALYALSRYAASNTAPPVIAGAGAPRFVATTLDSAPRIRTLDDYRGRPLLLNVWATWCDPCREEMPSLQRLYDAFKDRGLQVVAVSIDDPGNEGLIREYAAEHKLSFDILHDGKAAIMSQYEVRGVPESFLISATGEIRGTRFVADWSSAESRALVERLLFGGGGAK